MQYEAIKYVRFSFYKKLFCWRKAVALFRKQHRLNKLPLLKNDKTCEFTSGNFISQNPSFFFVKFKFFASYFAHLFNS